MGFHLSSTVSASMSDICGSERTTLTCCDRYLSIFWHDARLMPCFMWMQHFMHPSLLWRNLFSVSIDCDMFICLPLNSFFDMFADLPYLPFSSSSVKCMKACVIGLAGHLILTFSIDIPISTVVFSVDIQLLVHLCHHGTLSSLVLVFLCPVILSNSCVRLSNSVVWIFYHGHIFHSGDSLIHFVLSVVAVIFHFSIVLFIPCIWRLTELNTLPFDWIIIASIRSIVLFWTGRRISTELFQLSFSSLLLFQREPSFHLFSSHPAVSWTFRL